MNSAVIQLLVLAGIAVFLILKLKDVLGTRDGFEKPREDLTTPTNTRPEFEVIEGGPDRDITDHTDEGSKTAVALASMKALDPSFGVEDFLGGARGAYEMILMAFENGDLDQIKPFLAKDVFNTFSEVVADRAEKGLNIEASFIGVREMVLKEAKLNKRSGKGEIVVKFVGELTSVVKDSKGKVVEGDPTKIKHQRDVWTFGRKMGADDPNWQLIATGE